MSKTKKVRDRLLKIEVTLIRGKSELRGE